MTATETDMGWTPVDAEPDPPPTPGDEHDPLRVVPDRIRSQHLDLDAFELHASLHPVNLEQFLDGTYRQPVPDMLLRQDGRGLLYAGEVNGIHGQSGDGKGWVEAFIIRENARRGRKTGVLDFEDGGASWTSRLTLLGMEDHEILRSLVYIRPQVPLGPHAVDHLCQLIIDHNIAAVFIDSLGEAFALEAIDENKDVEVGPWHRRVARRLADTGAAVLIIDHGTKAADNVLFPSGSKRKRAAITGASYAVEAIKPFAIGQGGRLRLTCAKDRHGQYRRGEKVGDLVMISNPSSIELILYPPDSTGVQHTPQAILAARAAVTAAREIGRTVSQNELVGLMAIKAGAVTKRGGIDHAVGEGALTEQPGRGSARLFTYVRDLDTDD